MDLTLELFTPLVGQDFTIRAADGGIQAELLSATPGTGSAMPGGREPFLITFRGPTAPRLQQGLHDVAHPTLEPVTIFLVPIGLDDDGATYEAVFN